MVGVKFASQSDWTALRVDECPVGRVVVHVVVDTSEPVAAERLRFYVNGRSMNLTTSSDSSALPVLGDTIDLGVAPRSMHIGRAHSDTFVPAPADFRTAQSSIYFAAVYDLALTNDQVVSRVIALLSNDDR